MRNGDDPKIKDSVMAQLFGEVIGWLKSEGLTDEKEFATQTIPKFDCSTRSIWIDGIHPKNQIVIAFHSIGMDVEYGISVKGTRDVLYRKKIENLRYKISSGTQKGALTDGSQKKYDDLILEVKEKFEELKIKS